MFDYKNDDVILVLMDFFTEVQQKVLINHISPLANYQIQGSQGWTRIKARELTSDWKIHKES